MNIQETIAIPVRVELEPMPGWVGTYDLTGICLPWCRFHLEDYTRGCRPPKDMYYNIVTKEHSAEKPAGCTFHLVVNPMGFVEGEAPEPMYQRISEGPLAG